MSADNLTESTESLGEFLLRHRREKNLSVEDVVKETKIPARTLRAMESDDFKALPADAFARGFYTIIAKHLGLEEKQILERYAAARGETPHAKFFAPPLTQDKQVNVFAARPSMATGSMIGLTLVLLIIIIAVLSYYFSWNPASFLSEQLRSFRTPEIIQTTDPEEQSATTSQTTAPLEQSATNYFLSIEFFQDTPVTVATDDQFPEKEFYAEGSTHSWYANETITLILPAKASVALRLNGQPYQLPEPENDYITISIP